MKEKKSLDILDALANMFDEITNSKTYKKHARRARKAKKARSNEYVELQVVKTITIPYKE